MRVKINGAVDDIPDNSSIRDLLTGRKLSADIVIVALNDEIIKQEKWESLKLNSNDKLDIIRIMGGG